MTIGFRVDINNEIASGHFMRSNTLAAEFFKQGNNPIFIFSKLTSKKCIKNCKFSNYYISTNVFNNIIDEIKEVKYLVEKEHIDILFIDGYFFNKMYLEEINKFVRVVYFDDFIKQPLNIYAIYSSTFDEIAQIGLEKYDKMHFNTKKYIGTQYSLIREDILNANYEIRNKVSKILITTGNTDNYKFIDYFINIVKNINTIDYVFSIKVGMLFDSDKYEISDYDFIKVYEKNYDFIKLITESDIVISSAGQTLYELTYLGVPSISFSTTSNQVYSAKLFEKYAGLKFAGEFNIHKYNVCMNCIDFIRDLNDINVRSNINKKMKSFITKDGTEKLVKKIISEV